MPPEASPGTRGPEVKLSPIGRSGPQTTCALRDRIASLRATTLGPSLAGELGEAIALLQRIDANAARAARTARRGPGHERILEAPVQAGSVAAHAGVAHLRPVTRSRLERCATSRACALRPWRSPAWAGNPWSRPATAACRACAWDLYKINGLANNSTNSSSRAVADRCRHTANYHSHMPP